VFSLRELLPGSSSREEYQLKGAVLMTPGHFFSGFRTSSYSWTVFNDSNVSQVNVSSFKEFQASISYYAKPYLLFFERVSSDYQPPHQALVSQTPPQVLTSSQPFQYEAELTLFNVKLAAQIIAALGGDEIRTDYANYGTNSLLAALMQTASDLTQPSITSISGLFQSPPACRDVCDAYNAILQELSRVQPQLSLLGSFRILQYTEYSCHCRRETEEWSEDCFSISVPEVNSALDYLKTAFKSKPCAKCGVLIGTTQKLVKQPDILTIHKDDSSYTPNTKIQEKFELYDITEMAQDRHTSYMLAGAVFASTTAISTGFQKNGLWVKYANLGKSCEEMPFERFCSTLSSENKLIFLFYRRTHGHTASLSASRADFILSSSDKHPGLTHTRGISEQVPDELSHSIVSRAHSNISSDMNSGLAQSRVEPKTALTKAQHDLLLLALHGVASLFAPTVEQILVQMQSNAARDIVQTLIHELSFTGNSLHEALEFVMNQLSIKEPLELDAYTSCWCN
jgi:hypothetical protein